MKIKTAEFVKSAPTMKDAPIGNLPEVALLGRSNVGKSSFINMLCNRKKLAKTSNTPGKTRLLNYYLINEQFYIVDMPGYGYAKVSKSEQTIWRQNFEKYLTKREQLDFCIQFIDARHDVQKNDIQMREWLDYHEIPTVTVVNKIDQVKKSQLNKSLSNIKKTLGSEIIPVSASTGVGKDLLLDLFSNIK